MSGFLLDTNIPSELIRSRPEPRVAGWVYAQDEVALFMSVVTVGELRRGIVLLPAGQKRTDLEEWLGGVLVPRFGGRILPVTPAVADRWGVLDAESQAKGTPLNTADGLIAATALEHELTVVTRNQKDFAGLGVGVLNPWDA